MYSNRWGGKETGERRGYFRKVRALIFAYVTYNELIMDSALRRGPKAGPCHGHPRLGRVDIEQVDIQSLF